MKAWVVALLVVGLLLVGGSAALAAPSARSAPTGNSSGLHVAGDSPTLQYYNGTLAGQGTSNVATAYMPTPPNGTVWDLVSVKLEIIASSPVSGFQNSYIYDSTCTQLDVSPAGSNCHGLYGVNVDGWANDIMESGTDGTNVGEGGYSATEPPGLVQWTHFEQTIHVTYDTFTTIQAQCSVGVTTKYFITVDPEVGDFPSFAFFRYSNPVTPLSATLKTVTIPSPPSGYFYRVELAFEGITFGSAVGPYRLADLKLEPAGTVLGKINNWTTGHTQPVACGGYSQAQTCSGEGNGVGTVTVWDTEVTVDSSQTLAVGFVGVSGDGGDYGVMVTEYPATAPPNPVPDAPADLAAGSPTSSAIPLTWDIPGGGGILSETVTYFAGASCSGTAHSTTLDGDPDSYTLGGLASDTEYSADVTAANATGSSPASNCVTATTDSVPVTTVPPAPTGLEATVITPTSVVLIWVPATGGGQVNDTVYYRLGTVCSGTLTGLSTGGAATTITVNGLAETTTYSFTARAWNATGQGPASNCATETTTSGAVIEPQQPNGTLFGPPGNPNLGPLFLIIIVSVPAIAIATLAGRRGGRRNAWK